jgi:hypothetical protein
VKCQSPPFFDRRQVILVRLSSLIDRGRWFFPNELQEGIGLDKPEAYQGYRHSVLDSLVRAYRQVGKLDWRQQSSNRQLRQPLEEARRAFVSEVQGVLNPRERDREFERIMDQAGKPGST